MTSTADDRLDIDALRARYEEERQRRLRADGSAQYVGMEGQFQSYLDDPWAGPAADRDPIQETTEALIVGGGFGGLLCAAQLRAIGIDDVRIIEKAGDFGGTWYWNRYPGAACDTESYVYLPLLEETGLHPAAQVRPRPGDPRALPAHRPPLRPLRQGAVPDRRRRACAGTTTPSAGAWRPTAATTIDARFVVMASGPLNRPKLPGHPRHRDVPGPHASTPAAGTTRYTGGDADGT